MPLKFTPIWRDARERQAWMLEDAQRKIANLEAENDGLRDFIKRQIRGPIFWRRGRLKIQTLEDDLAEARRQRDHYRAYRDGWDRVYSRPRSRSEAVYPQKGIRGRVPVDRGVQGK